jgi:hypothetical protein
MEVNFVAIDSDKKIMREQEEKILATLNLQNV